MQVVRMSNRAFGLALGVLFVVLTGLAWLLFDVVTYWLLGIAGGLAIVAIVKPGLLLPFNRIWTGLVAPPLSRLSNFIILGSVFIVVLTPAGLIMRLFGRDPMMRTFARSAETYFVPVTRESGSETYRDTF